MKSSSLTGELPWILAASRVIGVGGTVRGAVKCVDMHRNSGGEGGVLDLF